MNVQRILVPVDYSVNSKRALGEAIELARKLGASVDIVHVWDRPTYLTDAVMVGHAGNSKPLAELVRENAERDMQTFLEEVSLPADVSVTHRLLSGEPAATLVADLEKGGHQLAVVGTHGRTGMTRLLMGSVAEKLVRLSPIPVLTVPPPR